MKKKEKRKEKEKKRKKKKKKKRKKKKEKKKKKKKNGFLIDNISSFFLGTGRRKIGIIFFVKRENG